MQSQMITQGSTTELPFVLLDSKTKLGKAGIDPATIKIDLAKAGQPLQPVAAPAIRDARLGLYYWTPTPEHTDTLGVLVYFANAPGTDDWRDFVEIHGETGDGTPVTLIQLTEAVRHDLRTEIGRLAAMAEQVTAIAAPVAQ